MTLIKNQSLPDRAIDAVTEGILLPFRRVFGDRVTERIAAIVVFFPLFLVYFLLVGLPGRCSVRAVGACDQIERAMIQSHATGRRVP